VLLGFGLRLGAQATLPTGDGARMTDVVTAKRIDPHYFWGIEYTFAPSPAQQCDADHGNSPLSIIETSQVSTRAGRTSA
jgi:hypothetical protein